MSKSTFLFVAALALCLAPGAYADDNRSAAKSTDARLIVECAPHLVPQVQAALKNLPVRVYLAHRLAPVARAPVPAPQPVRSGFSTSVSSVLPVWNAIREVAAQPVAKGLVIDRMVLTQRSARITVLAPGGLQQIQDVRVALSNADVLKRWSRGPNVVEQGAVYSAKSGPMKSDFTIPFGDRANDADARGTSTAFDVGALAALATKNQLQLFRSGRTVLDADRRTRMSAVYQENVFDATRLPNLYGFVTDVHEMRGIAPIEVRWQRQTTDQNRVGDVIQRPTVRFARWVPNK